MNTFDNEKQKKNYLSNEFFFGVIVFKWIRKPQTKTKTMLGIRKTASDRSECSNIFYVDK